MYALMIESTDAGALAERLNALPASTLRTRDAAPTSPGRLGAVYSAPEPALDAALHALREPVTVGLGVGRHAADEDPAIALSYARAAVDRSTARSGPGSSAFRNITVDGADPLLADAATGVCRLLARLVGTRSTAEWRVVDLVVPGVRGQHRAIAEVLGITPQAVSKALIRTGWHEQAEGVAAAAEILRRLETGADTPRS